MPRRGRRGRPARGTAAYRHARRRMRERRQGQQAYREEPPEEVEEQYDEEEEFYRQTENLQGLGAMHPSARERRKRKWARRRARAAAESHGFGKFLPGYQVPGTRAYARHKAWILAQGRRGGRVPAFRSRFAAIWKARGVAESDAVSRKIIHNRKVIRYLMQRGQWRNVRRVQRRIHTLQIARIQIARRYGLSRRLAKYLAELKASPYRRIVPPHRNYVPLQARYPQTNYQPLHPGAQQHYLQAAGLAGWGDTEEDEYGQIGLAPPSLRKTKRMIRKLNKRIARYKRAHRKFKKGDPRRLLLRGPRRLKNLKAKRRYYIQLFRYQKKLGPRRGLRLMRAQHGRRGGWKPAHKAGWGNMEIANGGAAVM
jgi:hypothetical protein